MKAKKTRLVMEATDSLRIGTASGTILSIVPNILSEDIAKTVILAMIGAMVSTGGHYCSSILKD